MLGKIFSSGGGKIEPLKSYDLPDGRVLHIAQGSVLDYTSKKGAIVNSADEKCLGGGGVDFAITNAGGPKLLADRKALPIVALGGIRCPKGEAKITGPNKYGKLNVPYVIHAVGPNYKDYGDDVETPNALLRSAYQSALDCTLEEKTKKKPIKKIAFSLISAGRFKGDQTLDHVLGIGVQAIYDWCKNNKGQADSTSSKQEVEQIILYGYNSLEGRTLTQQCDNIIGGDNVQTQE